MNKKVLIVTYYWPPSGGSGVQRWLKFVKYLPSYQWEPHVFTPENPSFGVQDPSLERDIPHEAEVMRFPIWEPYDVFFRLSGFFSANKKSGTVALVPSKNKTLFQRISTWVRGNFFIPDPRIFWVRPSVKFLSDYIDDNGIAIIITTGPPHSMHLIGLKLKHLFPQLRWIADFRDPWSEWGIWDSLMVSQPVRRMHKKLEDRVLKLADEIITITPFYVKRFEALARRPVRLLTNGFDEDDFGEMVYERSDRFLIRHIGIINEKCDPRPFMRAMKTLMEKQPDFADDVQLEFIGEVHPDFRKFVSADPALIKVTAFTGNIPHDELIRLYGSSSLLLLVLTGYKDAEGYLPGKLFEYMATGLPVLGIGPEKGDAAAFLQETHAGRMVESTDPNSMEEVLLHHFQQWKGYAQPFIRKSESAKYSRRVITSRLAEILADIK